MLNDIPQQNRYPCQLYQSNHQLNTNYSKSMLLVSLRFNKIWLAATGFPNNQMKINQQIQYKLLPKLEHVVHYHSHYHSDQANNVYCFHLTQKLCVQMDFLVGEKFVEDLGSLGIFFLKMPEDSQQRWVQQYVNSQKEIVMAHNGAYNNLQNCCISLKANLPFNNKFQIQIIQINSNESILLQISVNKHSPKNRLIFYDEHKMIEILGKQNRNRFYFWKKDFYFIFKQRLESAVTGAEWLGAIKQYQSLFVGGEMEEEEEGGKEIQESREKKQDMVLNGRNSYGEMEEIIYQDRQQNDQDKMYAQNSSDQSREQKNKKFTHRRIKKFSTHKCKSHRKQSFTDSKIKNILSISSNLYNQTLQSTQKKALSSFSYNLAFSQSPSHIPDSPSQLNSKIQTTNAPHKQLKYKEQGNLQKRIDFPVEQEYIEQIKLDAKVNYDFQIQDMHLIEEEQMMGQKSCMSARKRVMEKEREVQEVEIYDNQGDGQKMKGGRESDKKEQHQMSVQEQEEKEDQKQIQNISLQEIQDKENQVNIQQHQQIAHDDQINNKIGQRINKESNQQIFPEKHQFQQIIYQKQVHPVQSIPQLPELTPLGTPGAINQAQQNKIVANVAKFLLNSPINSQNNSKQELKAQLRSMLQIRCPYNQYLVDISLNIESSQVNLENIAVRINFHEFTGNKGKNDGKLDSYVVKQFALYEGICNNRYPLFPKKLIPMQDKGYILFYCEFRSQIHCKYVLYKLKTQQEFEIQQMITFQQPIQDIAPFPHMQTSYDSFLAITANTIYQIHAYQHYAESSVLINYASQVNFIYVAIPQKTNDLSQPQVARTRNKGIYVDLNYAVYSKDGAVRLYELRSLQAINKIDCQPGALSINYTPSGNHIVCMYPHHAEYISCLGKDHKKSMLSQRVKIKERQEPWSILGQEQDQQCDEHSYSLISMVNYEDKGDQLLVQIIALQDHNYLIKGNLKANTKKVQQSSILKLIPKQKLLFIENNNGSYKIDYLGYNEHQKRLEYRINGRYEGYLMAISQ